MSDITNMSQGLAVLHSETGGAAKNIISVFGEKKPIIKRSVRVVAVFALAHCDKLLR